MKIVLDVNVIISAVIAPLGFSRSILNLWLAERLQVVISKGIIAEVKEKLSSPRIAHKYALTKEDIHAVITLLRTQTDLVIVPKKALIQVIGDPEDDYVLATAAVGEVEYLVTGDTKLQDLGLYQGVEILSPKNFTLLKY